MKSKLLYATLACIAFATIAYRFTGAYPAINDLDYDDWCNHS